jgi:hypothetical protein
MLLEQKRLRKKVALFKRIGFIGGNSQEIRTRRAITLTDLEAAYELVYQLFLAKDYIDATPEGIRLRSFEALPEMATFVSEINGEIVGVMSIVPDSPDLGLPSDKAFRKEIDELRKQGRKVCEVTNLAIRRDRWNSGVFLSLAQPILAHALSIDADDIFIAISPGHAAFFEGVLQLEPWGDARDYSKEKADTVEGKRWDLRSLEASLREADGLLGEDAFLHDHLFAKNSHHHYVRSWATLARRMFMEPEPLRRLFVERSHFLSRCGSEVLDAIRRRWGDVVFDQVCSRETAAVGVA